MTPTDLNTDSPLGVPEALRRTAQTFYEDAERLRADWQDDEAGLVWAELAKVLDRAADSCDKVIAKTFL